PAAAALTAAPAAAALTAAPAAARAATAPGTAAVGTAPRKPLPVGPPGGVITAQEEREAAAAPPDTAPDPGGGWQQGDLRLTAFDNAVVEEFADTARTAERSISPTIRTVASWSGAEVVGFAHRLKSEDALKRTVATALRENPDQTVYQALADVHDSVRYTLVWEDADYTQGVEVATGMLSAWGHTNERWANTWKDRTSYQGITTTWRDPMYAHPYTIHFHTPASEDAARAAQPLEEERRLPGTTPERKEALAEQQARLFAAVPVPAGAQSLAAPHRPGRVPTSA
ncbi:ATP nucleotide 3'-pyrophosphokinase, partial [Streptomyces sp. JJ66]|uniref:ATP nucleotide 3'-pyrophosphokinase n=1 Tax=Streptomyces sp. JJ66 TaxID=2803843 RepID=UPI001C56E7BD